MDNRVKIKRLTIFLLVAAIILVTGMVFFLKTTYKYAGIGLGLFGLILLFVAIRQFIKASYHVYRRDSHFQFKHALTKGDRYYMFLEQFQPMIAGENDEISAMANTAAALREVFDFFWVGFYIVKGDKLVLGPFQGSMACSSIAYGKGVCGTAWKTRETQVVPNVEDFPGHIACSSLSRSEIVVPILANDQVKAVLDIDSRKLKAFNNTDKNFLEKLAAMISKEIYQDTAQPQNHTQTATQASVQQEKAENQVQE